MREEASTRSKRDYQSLYFFTSLLSQFSPPHPQHSPLSPLPLPLPLVLVLLDFIELEEPLIMRLGTCGSIAGGVTELVYSTEETEFISKAVRVEIDFRLIQGLKIDDKFVERKKERK